MNAAERFLARLESPEPLITVELRPPRVGVEQERSIDSWFGMHATVSRLLASDTVVFLTDSAVGTHEEENLMHVMRNLDDLPRERICPFLTTKHSLEHCLWFAARAYEAGFPALTVLGGDKHVGPPRCVPHGKDLRARIHERVPKMALGGWANPHRDPERQMDFLLADDFGADFYLTQLVSHHHLHLVERFLEARERRGLDKPGVWGVFYYRSAKRKTLDRLSRFFEVPVEGVTADFESGLSAAEVCAKTILELRRLGIDKVYVSNLHAEKAARQLEQVRQIVDAG